MNDELNNQLCSKWSIPTYAQDALWITTEFESVQSEGEKGIFQLNTPVDSLTVRWGGADGVGLAQLKWTGDALNWTGEVRVGGNIEAMHFIGAEDEETTLAVAVFGGQVLLPAITPYPRLNHTPLTGIQRAEFYDGIDRNDSIALSTWLVSYNSPLFVLCQDALSNKLNAYVWGRLSERSDARKLATPFQLHELTLFST